MKHKNKGKKIYLQNYKQPIWISIKNDKTHEAIIEEIVPDAIWALICGKVGNCLERLELALRWSGLQKPNLGGIREK